MPRYRATGPNGENFVVTAPEGATEQDVQAYLSAPSIGAPRADLTKPDIGQDKPAGFFAGMKASLAPGIEDQIKHLSQSMDIPENRFGVVDGNVVYADEDGRYQRATPEVFAGKGPIDTFQRSGDWMASQVGPAIPGAAAALTGVAMGPSGMSIPAAAVVAGATDVVRQGASNMLLGRGPLEGTDYMNSLGQATLGAVGQGGAMGVSRMAARNPLGIAAYERAAILDPARQQEILALNTEAQRRGIDLSAGQSTDLTSLLQKERQLGRGQETTDLMHNFAVNQRETQVPNAVRAEIASISPVQGEQAIQAFRGASEDVVNAAKQARRDIADPLYKEAFQSNQSVMSPKINRVMTTPSGRRALNDAVRNMRDDRAFVGIPDAELTEAARFAADIGKMDPVPGGHVAKGLKLRTLDYVKRALGDMEQTAMRAGQNDRARILGNLRRDFTKELDSLDVTGGTYKSARNAYATGSDALETIVDGGVGFVNNMSGLDRQGIVNRVFSATNITHEGVTTARDQFVAAGKIDDWNAGLASFLSSKLDDSMKMTASASRGNVPGKFAKSVWGDPAQQRIIRAAIGDRQKVDSFAKLIEVLQAASKGMAEGSPTATDLGAMTAAGKAATGVRVAGKVFSPNTYLNFGNELVAGLEALSTSPDARIQLANNLLAGMYGGQLKRLRLLSPTSNRALSITSQILVGTGVSALGVRTPRDQPIPDASMQR